MDVKDYFMVVAKTIGVTRENKKYMSLGLKDRTGTIEAKIWDEDAVLRFNDLFDKGDLVWVDSRTGFFQGKPQLKVKSIKKVENELPVADMEKFYRTSDRPPEELKAEYARLTGSIQNPFIASLFSELAARGDLLEKFMVYPASVGVHHVYLGGLFEHSLAVATMGEHAVSLAGGDRDIVVAGSLLHDIGKVEEIEMKAGFRYSDRGRLLGHITLGVMLFEELRKDIKAFPDHVASVLTHIIISHHGQEEWGSPRKPMCLEALVVHYLDNLDAKVMGVKEHMIDNMEDEKWTGYHRLYESRFYRIPEG